MESINRIIDVFPSHQQAQVRAQLSFVLEGVITQTLLQKPRARPRDGVRDPHHEPAVRGPHSGRRNRADPVDDAAGKKHGCRR